MAAYLVNAVSYTEFTPERRVRKAGGRFVVRPGKRTSFGWITDFEIEPEKLMVMMRAGRARWRIENEMFNVMKNKGMNLSHNYGHGNRNLSSVLVGLMVLAFLIDQIQERCCRVYQAARRKFSSKTSLWDLMRAHLRIRHLSGWDDLMLRIAGKRSRSPPSASA